MAMKVGNNSISGNPELDILTDSINISSVTNTNLINLSSATNVANITFNSNFYLSGTNTSLSISSTNNNPIITFTDTSIITNINSGFLNATSNIMTGEVDVFINNNTFNTRYSKTNNFSPSNIFNGDVYLLNGNLSGYNAYLYNNIQAIGGIFGGINSPYMIYQTTINNYFNFIDLAFQDSIDNNNVYLVSQRNLVCEANYGYMLFQTFNNNNGNGISFVTSNVNVSCNLNINNNLYVSNNIYSSNINAQVLNVNTINSVIFNEELYSENINSCNITVGCNLTFTNINNIDAIDVYVNIADVLPGNILTDVCFNIYFSPLSINDPSNNYNVKFFIDAFGQIVYNYGTYTTQAPPYSLARGLLDMSYYGPGIDTAYNIFYLQGIQSIDTLSSLGNGNFNTFNQIVVNSNAYIGIGTETPYNYLHIDLNYNNNLDYNVTSNVNALIGLYNNTICNISYIQATNNHNLIFDLSSNGNLTIGNIPITNEFNIDVSCNIRTPSLFTDTIYSSNTDSQNISFSNLTLNTSNIVSSNITTSNLNVYNLTANITNLAIAGLIVTPSNLTVDKTHDFIVQSSSNIFSQLAVDAQGIPISTAFETVKIVSTNYTVSTTPLTNTQTAVGLNISSPSIYRSSSRVSSTKGTGSIIEFYNYNIGNIYPNLNENVYSFAECGITSPSSGFNGFYIDYNEPAGTNQTGAIQISRYGVRLQHSLQINSIISPDNNNNSISNPGYVGIGLGGNDNNPVLPTTQLQVAGIFSLYPQQLTNYSIATPTILTDTLGNVIIGGKTNPSNYNLLVMGTSGFNGNAKFNGTITGNGSGISSLNATNLSSGTISTSVLPTSGVTIGNYGSSTNSISMNIDSYGRITNATNVSIPLLWTTNTATKVSYNTDMGNVGIGYSNTLISNHQYLLSVNGDAYINGNVVANNVSVPSDIRIKYNIAKIKDSVSKLKTISGYYYNRNDIEGNPKETGCIAQEVATILPEVVHDMGDKLAISYGNMTGIIIEAIKELDQRLSIIEDTLLLK